MRLSSRTITFAVSAQPIFHLIFISTMVSFGVGYAQGSYRVTSMYKAEAQIQVAVESFILKENRLPNTIEEVEKKSPYISRSLDIIKRSEIRIESAKDSKDKYQIIFPGQDEKIDTSDDQSVTARFDLSDFYDQVRSDRKAR